MNLASNLTRVFDPYGNPERVKTTEEALAVLNGKTPPMA